METSTFFQSINNIGDQALINNPFEVVFWILIALNLVFLAIAKTLNQNYIRSVFSVAILNRQLLQKTQEELKLGSVSSILLTLNYFNCIGIIVGFLTVTKHSVLAAILVAIFIGVALIKFVAMWFISFVSETRSGLLEHGFNHLIYYQVGGIILTPILILSHFAPLNIYTYIIYGCIIFIGFLTLLREVQSIGRAIKARVSVLYIILYLCTLEILPLVLITYAFVNDFNGLN